MWHGMEEIGWGWLGLGILHMVVFWQLKREIGEDGN